MSVLDRLATTSDYAMAALDNVFIVYWRLATTSEGVKALATVIQPLAAKYPEGIGLLTIIPPRAAPPAHAVRVELAAGMKMANGVKGSAVCFEGTGLRATIVRSVVTGITLLSGTAFPHRVFATLEEGSRFVHGCLTTTGTKCPSPERLVAEVGTWRRSVDG